MGLARQSVQRVVDELAHEKIVRLADNPHHKRARRVEFSARGEALYAAALERQGPWARTLAAGLRTDTLRDCIDLMRSLRTRLEADRKRGDAAWS
jgi:DNA-binding MarR family transcriptional regulator